MKSIYEKYCSNNMLENIVKYAYKKVPFYSELYKKYNVINGNENLPKDFLQLPLVQKSDVLKFPEKLLSEDYYDDYVDSRLINYHTSGSTGTCLDISWSEKNVSHSLLGLWYLRKKYYNINTWDRYCSFYSNMRRGYDEPMQVQVDNCLTFSKNNLTDSRISEIYNAIVEFQPVFMIVEPSIALLLCQCVKKDNLPIPASLKYIELTGEYLFEEVRAEIESVFKCKTANQYGAYEVNSIAYECPEGHLHCMTQNVLVEILDDNGNPVNSGEEGHIYLTSLSNYTMPFIRYNIGDIGKLNVDFKCKCGNSAPVLELINGRNNDMITVVSGRKIHGSLLAKVVENTNKLLLNPIMQFQINQIEYDKIIVKLVLARKDIDLQQLVDVFLSLIDEEELMGLNYEFQIYNNLLPNSKTGKLAYFTSEVK
ncbi:MAG: AMP-binding protein [Acutalibacteraceae bacterium]|nr:AMP-binding protein [Acutalibacteraceae bacterium]